jgi:hypothetical protein
MHEEYKRRWSIQIKTVNLVEINITNVTNPLKTKKIKKQDFS